MTVLTTQELALETAELLPPREALTGWSSNWANVAASNSALALNVGSAYSWAGATALQGVAVYQS